MEKKSLRVEDIVAQLTDIIVINAEWLPGDRIPNERLLAYRFGVSRNTIREAMRLLNANGILITKPGSGSFVAKPMELATAPLIAFSGSDKYQQMLDLYELRSIVESEAAAILTQRATDEEIRHIESYEQLCAKQIHEGKEWSLSDRQFHAAIAKATHNQAIMRLVPSIHLSAALGYVTVDLKKTTQNSLICHAQIIERIKARDPLGAALAVKYHMQRSVDDLKSVIFKIDKEKDESKNADKAEDNI